MDLGILKKVELAKKLNQQVKWDWKFGISKSKPELYNLRYESQPIDSQIFVDLVKYVSKEQYKFPLTELKEGVEVEIPESAWSDQQEKLLILFPSVSPKNEVLVSKRLKRFSVTKTSRGLVIKGDVGGLRKC